MSDLLPVVLRIVRPVSHRLWMEEAILWAVFVVCSLGRFERHTASRVYVPVDRIIDGHVAFRTPRAAADMPRPRLACVCAFGQR